MDLLSTHPKGSEGKVVIYDLVSAVGLTEHLLDDLRGAGRALCVASGCGRGMA